MKPVSVINIMKNGEFTTDKIEYKNYCDIALVCYIMQYIKRDFNTSKYPKNIEGIRTIKDNLGNRSYYSYIDKAGNDNVIQSIEHY